MTFFLKHPDTRIQNTLIAPEFIDDKPAYPVSFLLLQQEECAEQLREYAATVDISRQKHRRIDQLRHSHVYDIIFFQIDLRRTSRSLDHDDIRLFGQL